MLHNNLKPIQLYLKNNELDNVPIPQFFKHEKSLFIEKKITRFRCFQDRNKF